MTAVMDSPVFDRAPVVRYLTPLVNAEVKGRASASQLHILHQRENLVPWLAVLRTMVTDVERTIANSRADIEHMRPADGAQPTLEYRVAKADMERRNIARRRFLNAVQDKRDEVKMLLSSEGMTRHTLGSVIDLLINVESILDSGDLAAAHQAITGVIDALEKDANTL